MNTNEINENKRRAADVLEREGFSAEADKLREEIETSAAEEGRNIDFENLSDEDVEYLTKEWVEMAERAKAGDQDTIDELLYLVQAHALDVNHPMAID